MSNSGNLSRGLLDSAKIIGPGSASAKYDVLSALLVLASQGEGVEARLALRLSLLITARYNWRKGSFTVGQKELARMWGVTERTVKREMAELRGRGWITVVIPAARGRVASYKIDFSTVLRATAQFWDAVGPDFAARIAGAPEPAGEVPSNVVPLHGVHEAKQSQVPLWDAVAARMKDQDGQLYNAWFARIEAIALDQGTLCLLAPSRFVADYIKTHYMTRLFTAALAEDREVVAIEISSSN